MALTADNLKEALGTDAVLSPANEAAWDMCDSSSWEQCSSAAYSTLQDVTKADVTETKSYSKPPIGVQCVLFAARICLGEKIVFKGDVRTQSAREWPTSKKLLADKSLLKRLDDFDPATIDNKMMAALKKIVESPDPSFEFTYEALMKKSKATAAIAKWVLAVYQFGLEQAL